MNNNEIIKDINNRMEKNGEKLELFQSNIETYLKKWDDDTLEKMNESLIYGECNRLIRDLNMIIDRVYSVNSVIIKEQNELLIKLRMLRQNIDNIVGGLAYKYQDSNMMTFLTKIMQKGGIDGINAISINIGGDINIQAFTPRTKKVYFYIQGRFEFDRLNEQYDFILNYIYEIESVLKGKITK